MSNKFFEIFKDMKTHGDDRRYYCIDQKRILITYRLVQYFIRVCFIQCSLNPYVRPPQQAGTT